MTCRLYFIILIVFPYSSVIAQATNKIDSTGNVGIGTTSPDLKMHVSGTNGLPASSGSIPAGMLELRDKTRGASHGLFAGVSGTAPWGSWIQAQDANNLGTNYPLLLNPNGGNVGVGTASPSEKLSVNGNVSMKKCIVTQIGWSDYVFNQNYPLCSLSSLEVFVKKNKHLPDIPSAKEVEEKGISVGDSQALLLKKIEELTLYIIQQQKQINALQRDVRKLKPNIVPKSTLSK